MTIRPWLVRTALAVALCTAAACAGSIGTPAPATSPVLASGPLLNTERVLVVAHRGASYLAPEHTSASYDRALALGADVIEQDLQFTADQRLVVLHDETLNRTTRGTDCTGLVRERTLQQVQQCDAGTWFNTAFAARANPAYAALRVLTLDDVFTRYRDSVRYYIETKVPETAPGMEDSLVAVLTRTGLRAPSARSARRVILQSFSAASLVRLRQLAPDLPRVQLMERGALDPARLGAILDSIARYAQAIGPPRTDVTEAVVLAAHRRCLVVHPYTVNDSTEMRRLAAAGTDGMFSDRPDLLRQMTAEARPSPLAAGCAGR